MQSYGSGFWHHTRTETAPAAQHTLGLMHGPELPPIHLCAVPGDMWAEREMLASEWEGLTYRGPGHVREEARKARQKRAGAKKRRKAA